MWQREKENKGQRTAAAVEWGYKKRKKGKKSKDDRHEGFARGHPPYYWPRLITLNFPDLTGWGAVVIV